MEGQFDKKVAILIGVNTYERARSLRFCQQDAIKFGELLQQSQGFQPDNILTIIEGSRYLPTRGTIFDSISRMKKEKKVGKDDLLIFFFSGHGKIGDDGKDYVLPPDATPLDLENTAIRIEVIAEALKKTDCNNIVMFIDACRNMTKEEGDKSADEDIVDADDKSVSIGADAAESVRRAGIVTFFSCGSTQKSYEIPPLGHGSFTHGIIEAIGNGQGSSVSALDVYLRKRVPEINKKYGKPEQDPYCILAGTEKLPLPIFYSATQPIQVSDSVEHWQTKLADLYNDGAIDFELLDKTIAFLEQKKADSQFEKDPLIIAIRGVCEGGGQIRTLIEVWKSIERKTAKPKPKTSL
jgi:uncharacterized caspase-like protein